MDTHLNPGIPNPHLGTFTGLLLFSACFTFIYTKEINHEPRLVRPGGSGTEFSYFLRLWVTALGYRTPSAVKLGHWHLEEVIKLGHAITMQKSDAQASLHPPRGHLAIVARIHCYHTGPIIPCSHSSTGDLPHNHRNDPTRLCWFLSTDDGIQRPIESYLRRTPSSDDYLEIAN